MPGGASHRLLLVYAPPAPHRGVDNARPARRQGMAQVRKNAGDLRRAIITKS